MCGILAEGTPQVGRSWLWEVCDMSFKLKVFQKSLL